MRSLQDTQDTVSTGEMSGACSFMGKIRDRGGLGALLAWMRQCGAEWGMTNLEKNKYNTGCETSDSFSVFLPSQRRTLPSSQEAQERPAFREA